MESRLTTVTDSDADALALARSHFHAGNYARALSCLARGNEAVRRLSSSSTSSVAVKYLAAHCYVRQDRHSDALEVLGPGSPDATKMTKVNATRRKMRHMERGPERNGPGRKGGEATPEEVQYEAGMWYLRGRCYAQQNALERAKTCYQTAVQIDVRCFEAFDALMSQSLLSPGEEWEFMDSLDFAGAAGGEEAGELTRHLYVTRLSTYAQPEASAAAVETLTTHYGLGDNADVRQCRAEMLFARSRYEAALELTTAILTTDPHHLASIPLHVALLHHLDRRPALYALAHDLADTHPRASCTWLAVGAYYLTTGRMGTARAYFSQASLLDAHSGPAWVGFAHTFAAEGETDQAIAAYSTAARLLPGTHLPALFLGMQELSRGQLTVAREHLTAAYARCDADPLLLHEMGVVAYREGDAGSAARHFALALELARDQGAPARRHRRTRVNLAHALRRAGRFPESLAQLDEVIRLGARDAGVFAARGLVALELERAEEAVVALHQALAVSPQDPVAGELLALALEAWEREGGVLAREDEEAVDRGLRERLGEARRRGGRRSRRREVEGVDGMDLDGVAE